MKKLKYIIMSLVLCGLIGETGAQTLISESFESDGPSCGTQAFLQGCFPDWINTHGSSGLKLSSISNPSFDGDKHVRMYVHNRPECENPNRGEGIALNFHFEEGMCYSLSYAIRGSAAESAWYLTNGFTMNGDTGFDCTGNDVVPFVPPGSMPVPGTDFLLDTEEWIFVEQTFTPFSDFEQLWFRASNLTAASGTTSDVYLDLLEIKTCCRSQLHCSNITDLTACPQNNDFGSISVECLAEFEWAFPAGSTAQEITEEDQTILINVSPGTYLLTATNSEGCVTEYTYDVVEDCCEVECNPPMDLGCKPTTQGSPPDLGWEPVPGAQGYIVNIIPNDPECGCEIPSGNPLSFQTVNPYYIFNFSPNFNCFSWNVVTICEGDNMSESSVTQCVDSAGCN